MPESTEMIGTQKMLKSVDITVLFRGCGIRYNQGAFHSKGVKITDRKTSAPMRFSHGDSAIGTKDGNYCGNDLSIAPVQRHSGSVTHTAEDD